MFLFIGSFDSKFSDFEVCQYPRSFGFCFILGVQKIK
jgi:hypothetical protein